MAFLIKLVRQLLFLYLPHLDNKTRFIGYTRHLLQIILDCAFSPLSRVAIYRSPFNCCRYITPNDTINFQRACFVSHRRKRPKANFIADVLTNIIQKKNETINFLVPAPGIASPQRHQLLLGHNSDQLAI